MILLREHTDDGARGLTLNRPEARNRAQIAGGRA
jgi:uncharacterized protein YheU (UPF0270 family)